MIADLAAAGLLACVAVILAEVLFSAARAGRRHEAEAEQAAAARDRGRALAGALQAESEGRSDLLPEQREALCGYLRDRYAAGGDPADLERLLALQERK